MDRVQLVPLSAPTPRALDALAERLTARLRGPRAPALEDVAFTYQSTRGHFARRRALVTRTGLELADACSRGLGEPSLAQSEPRVVFMFSGQGSQRAGAVEGLVERFGDFAHTWRRCEELMDPSLPASLDTLARASAPPELLAQTAVTQPLVFAVGAALADTLRALGVLPSLVLGHSLGEYVAAYVAGALSLEDACHLVLARGRLMTERCEPGALLAVSLSEAELSDAIAKAPGLEVCAVNGPAQTVAGGSHAAIEALARHLLERGTPHHRLGVSHAFHSALVEPMLEPFAALVKRTTQSSLHTPMLLGIDGVRVDQRLPADYWVQQTRRAVRFDRGAEALAQHAPALIVEIGSRPVLSALLLPDLPTRIQPTLRASVGAVQGTLEAVAAAYEAGSSIAWAVLHEGRRPRRVHVPGPPLHADASAGRAPAPSDGSRSPRIDRAPPSPAGPLDPTGLRATLRAAWVAVLGLPPEHDATDLLDAGADSLALLQLSATLQRALGRRVEIAELLEHRTIAALAAHLLRRAPDEAPVAELPSAGEGPWFPLSPAQASMLLAAQLPWARARDNLPALIPWTPGSDPERLRAAFEAVVQRHPALRTTFAVVDGEPRQHIESAVPWTLRRCEVGDPSELRALYHALAREPLALDRCCFRLVLIESAEQAWLVLTVHHLVFDGWSMGLVKRDLLRAHAGEPLPPPPRLRHVDFVAWQQRYLASAAPAVRFWRAQLAGAPAPALPLDRRRERPDSAGATVIRSLAPAVVERLHAVCSARGATPFMGLLSIFGALLASWSGRDEVVVGTPVAGRPGDAFADVVGSFVNVLPIRCVVQPSEGLHEHLDRTRTIMLQALEHRDLPFARIVSEVAPDRTASSNPLFNALFAHQNVVENAAGALEQRHRLGLDGGLARLDLSLLAIEHEGALWLELEHALGSFDPTTAQALLDRFATLVERLIEHPERPLAEPLAAELVPSPSARLAQHASTRPSDVALRVDGSTQIRTWAQLDAAVTAKAERLRQAGLREHALVAIEAERTPEAVEWMLACLRARVPYLPLDPLAPLDRRDAQLATMRVELSITDRSSESSPAPTWSLTTDAAEPLSLRPAPPRTSGSRHTAYVMLTSGSTGIPHGVEIGPEALAGYLRWAVGAYDLGPGVSVPLFTSLAFDLSITSLLGAIWAGAELELYPSAHPLETVVERLVWQHGPVLLKLTPSHLTAILELLGARALPGAVTTVVGGEALDGRLVARWFRAVPGARVFNEYGPTEATVGCCAHHVERGSLGDGPLPIDGLCPPGTELRLVGSAPDAARGELYIGGPQLAHGYRGEPELDAQRFVVLDGRRAYRTGDLVERGVDARLRYLGRIDDQVKIRGHRVELGELDALLQELPAVRSAAAVVHGGGPQAALVGFVVLEPSAPPLAVLEDHLARRLPPALRPRLQAVDALPLTSRGKLDRRRLAQQVASSTRPAPSASLSPVEQEIAKTWVDVLGCGPVGRDDDFFALGGHSLAMFRILAQLKGRHPALDIELLFVHRTPATLATALERREARPARLAVQSGPCRVLVTGATGFLGVHVVASLLRRPDLTIVCPVRPTDQGDPSTRWSRVAERFLDADQRALARARVQIHPGDVTREDLGLPSAIAAVDAVIHCAAEVAHLGDAQRITTVNVRGTQHAHALAARLGAHFHHVSSLGVLPPSPEDRGEVRLCERHVPPSPPRGNAYTRSKQAAEHWLRAQLSGPPVTIHRVGNLVGRASDGCFQLAIERSAFHRMLKAWILLGLAPHRLASAAPFDLTPVDFAAEAIVALMQASEPRGPQIDCVHICHPELLDLPALVHGLATLGHSIELVERSTYARRIHRMLCDTPTREGLELAAMHADPDPTPDAGPLAWPRPDPTATLARLAALGVPPPPDALTVLAAVLEEGTRRGFFPPLSDRAG